MNRFDNITKPLTWFMALLLVAFMAACSNGDKSPATMASVVSVAVTPATPTMPIGITQQFTATATYSDGLTHDVTAAPGIVWTSGDTAIATISTAGIATGVASGTSVITAAIGGQSATVNLTVNAAVLQSIAVTPAAPSIPVSTTRQFTALATYDFGPVIDVTADAGMVWSSGTPGVATIDPATGLATAVASGSSVITATFGGQSATATLTVNAAVLQSIAVTPAAPVVALGLTRQFTAMATYDSGPVINVTTAPGMVWSSGTTGVATIDPATGLATTVSAGSSVITADFGGQTDTAALTVTAATLSSIAVTPAAPSIVDGNTQQFVATATYSDATTAVVTADPGTVWTSSNLAVATIVSTTGLATGVAAGATDITADFGGATSPAVTLTVTAAPATVLPGIAGTAGANATNPTVNVASPSEADANVPTKVSHATGAVYTVTPKLLTATFNEAMDPATITPVGVFTLWNNTLNVDEPGTVTMNAANTVATFTPTAAALAANTSYTAMVSTAAMNAGSITALPKAVAWSFTTRAANAATQTANIPFVGQEPVDLLTAGNYVIFSDTAIANPGAAGAITGDIATGPGVTSTAITGFSLALDVTEDFSRSVPPALVVGKVYAFDYKGLGAGGLGTTPAAVTTASSDMLTAYNEAAARSTPDATELGDGTGNITGMIIYPGLYKWSTSVSIPTSITLDAQGDSNAVWIFQIAGDLGIASGADLPTGIKVILAGNAQAKNVFWQVGGLTGATLGTYSTFKGNIMSAKQIINQTGNVVDGKELAQTQVSLDASVITNQ